MTKRTAKNKGEEKQRDYIQVSAKTVEDAVL